MPSITKKKYFILSLSLLVVAGVFLVGHNALAESDWANEIIAGLLGIFIWALGIILGLALETLIVIASYQHFIDSQAVILGWVIVRDICNMFFVIVLMIIAFGTILHLEEYSYKKWLPKLILMAILINFSKTICGLLIDVTQVAMLTFVNAFKDIGGGNAVEMLGISEIVTLSEGNLKGVFNIVGAYLLGMIYLIVSIVVIVTMMMMLVMRLVMIWIYVVLSPAAYLLSAFPGGQKYASQWWSEFIKNLIVGPVLAFFIWLSLASLGAGSSFESTVYGSAGADEKASAYGTTINQGFTVTNASKPSVLIKFVVAIGMLVGGLMVSQQIGGAAGGLAGKGIAALQKGKGLALSGGKKLLSGDNYLARKTMKIAGFDVRPVAIGAAIKSGFEKTKRQDETDIKLQGIKNLQSGGARAVLGGVGAGADWTDNYVGGFLGVKGIKNSFKEMFSNPGKRKDIKQDIDKKSEEIRNKKEEFDSSISHTKLVEEENNLRVNREKESSLADDKFQASMKVGEARIAHGEFSNEYKEAKKKYDELDSVHVRTKKENDSKEQEIIERRTSVKSDEEYERMGKEIKDKENEMSHLKKKLAQVATPKALETRGEYRKAINESTAKIKDVTNADELINLYDDADRRDNKFDKIAVLEKLSHDANLNEVLNDRGYGADAEGLYRFTHNMENVRGEKRGVTGLDDQEVLQLFNDLGESEERVGHWEMAKTVVMNDKGELVSSVKPKMKNAVGKEVDWDGKNEKDISGWDDSAHVIASASEIAKLDPQKILTSLNRLAVGGENGFGKFQLSNLGRVLIQMLDQAGVFDAQKGRLQNNLARNLASPEIFQELKDVLNITKASLDAIKLRSAASPSDILNKMAQAQVRERRSRGV
ncbi:MAG: hypothetical protein WC456_00415 [Patescibacteria group bacterium]